MNLLPTWRPRYCPLCSGEVVPANSPLKASPWLGIFHGGAEIPVWVSIGVGMLVASLEGLAVGLFVGLGVGVALCAAWVVAGTRLQRKHLVCACVQCGERFPFEQLLRRKRNVPITPS
jgi:hypothetical protein